jgi:tRNA-dihydrouridine synthase 2
MDRGALTYRGCVIAAPMVRVSAMAFRVYCAQNGADVVFTEELVAAKLAKCVREEVTLPIDGGASSSTSTSTSGSSAESGSETVVEFVHYEDYKNTKRRSVVCQTLLRGPNTVDFSGGRGLNQSWFGGEGCPCVIQLGAADAQSAGAAAAVVADDFDGIDVNMGCPKKFSVDNGMGAALMCDPERAASILQAIWGAANSPEALQRRNGRVVAVSMKTRLFDTVEESIHQLSTILKQCPFLHAITLHCRTRPQRSETMPNPLRGMEVARRIKALFPWIAFVYNGSIRSVAEGHHFLEADVNVGRGGDGELAGARAFDGVMSARGFMWDPVSCSCVCGGVDSKHNDQTSESSAVLSALKSKPGLQPELEGNCKHTPEGIDVTAAAPLPLGVDSLTAAQLARAFIPLLRLHLRYNTNYSYVKYHLTRTFPEYKGAKRVQTALQAAKSTEECLDVLNLIVQGRATAPTSVEGEGKEANVAHRKRERSEE